jgi:hypothetical protein
MSKRFLAFAVVLSLAGWVLAKEVALPPGAYTAQLGGKQWTLKLTDKGKFSVSYDGDTVVMGSFTVTKDEIAFSDEAGKFAEKEAGPGRYRWKYQDGQLRFTTIQDKGPGRQKALTFGPWKKQK